MSETSNLIQQILQFQGNDANDVAIDVLHDSGQVFVQQDGWGRSDSNITVGNSIESALAEYLEGLKAGLIVQKEPQIFGYLEDIFDLEAAIVTADLPRFEAAVTRIRKDKF